MRCAADTIQPMNRLPVAKRAQILSMLCEGMSMRATSRLADVSINTVSKLLVDAGKLCTAFHDEMVQNVNAKRVRRPTKSGRSSRPSRRTLPKNCARRTLRPGTFGRGRPSTPIPSW